MFWWKTDMYWICTKYVLSQNELKEQQDKIKKLQTFYSSIVISQSYFGNDGSQNYLIFQSIYKTITKLFIQTQSLEWESKRLSNKKIKP